MLSKKEINYLFDFTRRKRVRYKDVQIELVDHLASAIEDMMEQDDQMTFEKALEEVYSGFGIFGFAKVLEEKSKAMKIFWRRRVLKCMLRFFKLPRILLTMFLFIISYELMHFQIVKPAQVLFFYVIGLLILLIGFMYKNFVYDNEIRDFLYVQSYYGYVGGSFFMIYGINSWSLADTKPELWVGNELAYMVLSILMTLFIIFSYVCFYFIPKELMIEFRDKYGKYLAV